MAVPLTRARLILRLRTIEGHLRGTRGLVRTGRLLEAVAQLRAMRAAIGDVGAAAFREADLTRDAVRDLVRMLRPGATGRRGVR